MKSFDIIGYTYKADIYCPGCIIGEMIDDYPEQLSQLEIGWNNTEDDLAAFAKALGIDWENYHSFDTDDFPKVIFADQDEDDYCCKCNTKLIS